jgi:hypothetical protein
MFAARKESRVIIDATMRKISCPISVTLARPPRLTFGMLSVFTLSNSVCACSTPLWRTLRIHVRGTDAASLVRNTATPGTRTAGRPRSGRGILHRKAFAAHQFRHPDLSPCPGTHDEEQRFDQRQRHEAIEQQRDLDDHRAGNRNAMGIREARRRLNDPNTRQEPELQGLLGHAKDAGNHGLWCDDGGGGS